MRRAAVLGTPVTHSLSPLLHNSGYAALGLSGWQYTAIECDVPSLASLVDGLDSQWAGLSLTMPLKEAVLDLADEVSDMARRLGAANTLVLGENGRFADNTDAPGLCDALAEVGMRSARRVGVLGAGGTARAAIGAAGQLGADEVVVFARREAAIEALRPVADACGVALVGASWDDAIHVSDNDVVVSTVPKGVADGLSIPWRASTVVFDVVYDPWPTPLARDAQARGCVVLDGLALLLAQAVRQFELFTGVVAPVTAMKQALLRR